MLLVFSTSYTNARLTTKSNFAENMKLLYFLSLAFLFIWSATLVNTQSIVIRVYYIYIFIVCLMAIDYVLSQIDKGISDTQPRKILVFVSMLTG